MSEITKKALANSLKKLMKEKPLSKITVNDVVKDCGLNRRTLYYYFHDIYDLLEWIFITDILEAVGENKHYENWQKGFLNLLYYLKNNKKIVLNAYHSIDRDRLELHLYDTVAKFIYDVVEELSKGLNVSIEDKNYVVKFYEIALTGMIIDWIKNKMDEDPEILTYKLNKIIEGDIKRALKKFEKSRR
ncbi:TetR family transcriptional regulator [Marinitoga sp. 1197]|uniref:TetR/AcrR family transcriptional regulator C-terminal domain-containing protein n=1 Tax=unclassified Marinitoga TaxID=2640159 RepID=UPI0006415CCD|nr:MULTISPECIES: TetR/AcrR family transcriptional regulator C-terminal domain-containing protein [unclassified Marinitoga]KLO21696.1 TetR family transcriptional regulator [Marinitoga sp. 1155]KLO22569.1 TetR family transcriptional regulator [Marinitoga sp. 1197]